MDLAVVAEQLQVAVGLVEDQAFELAAVGERDGGSDRAGAAARTERAQEPHEAVTLGGGQAGESRHARGGPALAHERVELLIGLRRGPHRDRGTELAAVAVAAVAAGAAVDEHAAARLDILRARRRREQREPEPPPPPAPMDACVSFRGSARPLSTASRVARRERRSA